ncbi:MAG: Uma2 family endonuclease [Blastocatellia bacterium]
MATPRRKLYYTVEEYLAFERASEERYDFFSYPDVMVYCGAPEFHDGRRDVLLNPKVVVEILSPSTEAFDRGEKFIRYRTYNDMLTDYILVSQKKPFVEH